MGERRRRPESNALAGNKGICRGGKKDIGHGTLAHSQIICWCGYELSWIHCSCLILRPASVASLATQLRRIGF